MLPEIEIVNVANPRHYAQVLRLAEFLSLDKVVYHDDGNRERYDLHKDGRMLRVTAAANHGQGGFLVVDEVAGAPPAAAPAGKPVKPRQVRSALLLADLDVPPDHVGRWTTEQRLAAFDWAIRVHLDAGDNDDVVVPPRPGFLDEYGSPELGGVAVAYRADPGVRPAAVYLYVNYTAVERPVPASLRPDRPPASTYGYARGVTLDRATLFDNEDQAVRFAEANPHYADGYGSSRTVRVRVDAGGRRHECSDETNPTPED